MLNPSYDIFQEAPIFLINMQENAYFLFHSSLAFFCIQYNGVYIAFG